jgi:betaine-homocysteine S-methyltransferase
MHENHGPGLMERLTAGPVICAEGYLFEFERRGYVSAGTFIPEIVLDHPELVQGLHREFVHAGSDIVEAFTYYAHREKLRRIGREGDLEIMNRQALRIAKAVARETGTLFSGDICNTNIFDPTDAATHAAARGMFDEQVGWAADAGVDMMIAETFYFAGEALIALEAALAAKVPVVVTLAVFASGETREGWSVVEACQRLEAAGASVVGLNCIRGPATMMPLLRQVRAGVRCHVGALPVPFRTHTHEPTFHSLTDPGYDKFPTGRPYPTALEPLTCNRYEIGDWAREASALGVRYLGLCCGAGPQHIRGMAEALGLKTPASRYSADLSERQFVDAGDPKSR